MNTLAVTQSRTFQTATTTTTNPTTKKRTTPPGPLNYFFIRHQGRFLKIRIRSIDYIEARKNYCRIVTKTGAFLTIVTLKRMAEILPSTDFCQIHRAFIVAVDWINSFDRDVVYGPDQTLPIGETYRPMLKKRFTLIGERNPPARHLTDFNDLKD